MIPVLYEFKRVITSKSVIVMTALILIFSGLSVLTGVSGNISPAQETESFGWGYGSNGSYNISVFLINGYGQPLQRTVNLTIANQTPSMLSSNQGYANFTLKNVNESSFYNPGLYVKSTFYNYTGFSGSNYYGYVNVYPNYSDPYFFKYSYKSFYNYSSGKYINGTANVSRFQFTTVSILGKQSENGLDIIYNGNFGTSAPTADLYYKGFNLSNSEPIYIGGYSENNMTYYSSYQGYNSIIVNPSNLSSQNYNAYMFELFSPTGNFLGAIYFNIETGPSLSYINSQFFNSEMGLMGFFVPLMAALAGYFTYGKDKTGGVIESTLVRPVSRKGLIFSRYFANISSVFIATAVSLGVSSLAFYYYAGSYLPTYTILLAMWALFVEIGAFTGLIYLASNYIKSQGALIGFLIAIFFVFVLFWSSSLIGPLIPYALLTFLYKGTIGGIGYSKILVMLLYISPGAYTTLANALVNGFSYVLFIPQNVTLSQVGLTTNNILITGAIWVVAPFVLALLRYMRKD